MAIKKKKPAKKAAKKAVKKKASPGKGSAPALPSKVIPKTSVKPPLRTGRGGTPVPVTTKPFTAENQPDPELKKKGWARRRTLKQLMEFRPGIMGETNWAQITADFYGIPVEEVTNLMILDFRQFEKAIKKADTHAYIAFRDRALGRPTQAIELIPDMTIKINGKVVKQKAS